MSKYRVHVREENWGWVEVEAESAAAAEEAVLEDLDVSGRPFWLRARDQDGETSVDAEETRGY
jgi:hypothetical protein